MENEFGDEISEDAVQEISERISVLSPCLIDELFDSVGFVVVVDDEGNPRESRYQALPENMIMEIKRMGGESVMVRNLLRESRVKDVRESLRRLEERADN